MRRRSAWGGTLHRRRFTRPMTKPTVGFHGKFCTLVDGKRATWFIQSLVAATAAHPVTDIPLSELDPYLDVNCWFHADKEPTLRAILEHWRRMEAADLSCPIILSIEHGVMDGMHRILKAHTLGISSIPAVRLETTPPPDLVESYP